MKLLSVETTPNPNSIKLNLDGTVGETRNYTLDNLPNVPETVQALLKIDGVVSVFACANFYTINRHPATDWQFVLKQASSLFETSLTADLPNLHAGEAAARTDDIKISVLMFKGIPMQIKGIGNAGETRLGLSSRFTDTVQRLRNETSADFIKERYWQDWGSRRGEPELILQAVADEIESMYSPEKIEILMGDALNNQESDQANSSLLEASLPEDWQKRLQALEAMPSTETNLPAFIQALQDPKPKIRRWAAARLGTLGSPVSVPALIMALQDDNVGVRRTAGDSLSDIGDASAELAMCRALSDENKLVRWRAARFLFELGTEAALPYLEDSAKDPEYEVRLEVEAALGKLRFQSQGKAAAGPIWKQMAEGLSPKQ